MPRTRLRRLEEADLCECPAIAGMHWSWECDPDHEYHELGCGAWLCGQAPCVCGRCPAEELADQLELFASGASGAQQVP